jgi:hypothetical protein
MVVSSGSLCKILKILSNLIVVVVTEQGSYQATDPLNFEGLFGGDSLSFDFTDKIVKQRPPAVHGQN